MLKYVHLFAIGPPPVNDKGTVHFCTKRNPQKCIKKFRGEIWRRWNYFARSPHNRIPTPAPAGLRSKILWWSPTDTMAETSRTVRVLLHPAQECMHLSRTHWLSWRFFFAKCTVLQVLLYLKSLTHNLNCQICRQVLKINLIDQIFW